jgi:hypothetical protein
MASKPSRHLASGLFPTGVGILIADELSPLVDTLEEAKDQHPLDVLGGIGMTLSRRLARLERDNQEHLHLWVHEYCAFILERFGGIEVEG